MDATDEHDEYQALLARLDQDRANFDYRYAKELSEVSRIVELVRERGDRIVLTSGSFDIIHEGHSMYLEAARERGDFLIVGVDSDAKVRRRKAGAGRPAVPELERLRMVTHQRGVGLVTLKHPEHEHWALIRAVRPDVLIATEDTYKPEEIAELEAKYCGRVEVLPRMATISTSARLRQTYFELATALEQRIPDLVRQVVSEFTGTR